MRPLRPAHGTLAVVAALALTACAGSSSNVRASHADVGGATSIAPAAVTATTSAPPTTAAALPPAPEGAGRAVVAVNAPRTMPPAVIEVRAVDADGWYGVATVAGPGGPRTAPLDGGTATFDGLGDGVYEVTVRYESAGQPPAGGVDVGTAISVVRAGTFGLVAGDTAVVTCSPDRCSAVL